MIQESNKILGSNIDITATCVRIPVLVSHSISENVEFYKDYTNNWFIWTYSIF